MSTEQIDPEKLEAAINSLKEYVSTPEGLLVLYAAQAHLTTLPRVKEVELVRWAVIDQFGYFVSVHTDRDLAEFEIAGDANGSQVVRLTGTAKIKVPA